MNQKNDPTQLERSKIVISLIHNNDRERLSRIRPQITDLTSELRKKMEVESFDVSWQPDLKKVSLHIGILRDLMHWKLNREWIRYKRNKNKFLLTDFLSFVTRTTRKCLFDKDISQKWLRSSAIEMFLTNKHLQAYANALRNKADYLLVFEDDAIFKKDSITRLSHLIDDLEKQNGIPTYIDLAGGVAFDDLKIDALESRRDTEFRYYEKPVTNTTCCYLVNREQLKSFDHLLMKKPMLRYIRADWLLNKLFILQSKAGIASNCRHADAHIFEHGSAIGKSPSLIR
jgi:hypothetical protein